MPQSVTHGFSYQQAIQQLKVDQSGRPEQGGNIEGFRPKEM
jgi:hypothetical protein